MGRQGRSKRESGEQFTTALQREKTMCEPCPQAVDRKSLTLSLRMSSRSRSRKDGYWESSEHRADLEARGCEEHSLH